MHSPHILFTSVCFCVPICPWSFFLFGVIKRKCDLLSSWWTICWNWLFSTYLWRVNIKQFVFKFQCKFRHFIACRSSWMILATHTPPTLVLPLLFLYSLPLLRFCRCLAFLPEGGPRVQEWGGTGCTPAPGCAFACSDTEQRLGWALWLGDLACLGTLDFCCPAPVISSW